MNSFEEMVKNARLSQAKETGQMLLGEMITVCEGIRDSIESDDDIDVDADKTPVIYDFCGMGVVSIDSWRGSYAELALNAVAPSDPCLDLGGFIAMLKDAVEKKFRGYKGGEYFMDKNTTLWVSNWGEYHSTAVVGVMYDGVSVVIQTAYAG